MEKSKEAMSLLGQILPLQSPSSGADVATEEKEHVPLPDDMRASSLVEHIGKERSWTDDQIEADVNVLDNNRLYYVHDLRALSNQSWTTIELLPLVRDLLQNAIASEWNKDNSKKADAYKKKKMKTKKKEKKYHLNVIDNPDPETAKNTIFNSVLSTPNDLVVDATEPAPKGDTSRNFKSVSFMAATKTIDRATSSSSSSSSSSSESEMDDDAQQKHGSGLANASSSGPPGIKPVDSNTIRVRTASGRVFDCQRQCPHKSVDLVRYGRVQGNSLVCVKHGWSFNLISPSMDDRKIRACQVNDW